MTQPGPSSLRRDVLSAYCATAAKIGSWVVVLGFLYRSDKAQFAILALIRGTIGILNYTTFGLSPAMIRMLAERHNDGPAQAQSRVLSYASPTASMPGGIAQLYVNGLIIAMISGLIGLAISLGYAFCFTGFYRLNMFLAQTAPTAVFWIGVGTVLRLMSDAQGSILQSYGRIAADNFLLAEAESIWAAASACLILYNWGDIIGLQITNIAYAYAGTGALLLVRRAERARIVIGVLLPPMRLVNEQLLKRLFAFGALVMFAQLADYLYAPTDYILISKLLSLDSVRIYTPAMQIDAGLLMLVTGLSSVMLPRAALAHTAGETGRVRRYYLVGTLASASLLLLAALAVWILAPWIFRLWLGDPMRPTQLILPLVLIHTVVGGSSAVGRSILLGMGKVKPFTIAVLIAGVANVLLSYIFVRQLHLGLPGIVYGTLIAVIARCALWMPWYVLRSLKSPVPAS